MEDVSVSSTTKLQATVVEDPTQNDFFASCNACCAYAKTHLASYMVTKHRDEVLELMGAIAHVQVIAANRNAQRDQGSSQRFVQSPCEHL